MIPPEMVAGLDELSPIRFRFGPLADQGDRMLRVSVCGTEARPSRINETAR